MGLLGLVCCKFSGPVVLGFAVRRVNILQQNQRLGRGGVLTLSMVVLSGRVAHTIQHLDTPPTILASEK